MGRISEYTKDTSLMRDDKVSGTDSATGATSNFTLNDLSDFAVRDTASKRTDGHLLSNSGGNLLESNVMDRFTFVELDGGTATTTSNITIPSSNLVTDISTFSRIIIEDEDRENRATSRIGAGSTTTSVVLETALTAEQLSAFSRSGNTVYLTIDEGVYISGNLTIDGSITGVATSVIAGDVELTGDVTGSSTFDDGGVTSIDTTIPDGSIEFSQLTTSLQQSILSGGGGGASVGITTFTATQTTADLFNNVSRDIRLNWDIELGGHTFISATISATGIVDIDITTGNLTSNQTLSLTGDRAFTLTLVTRDLLGVQVTNTANASANLSKTNPGVPFLSGISGIVTSLNEVIPEGRTGNISYSFNAGDENGWTSTGSTVNPQSPVTVNSTDNVNVALTASWESGSDNIPDLFRSGGIWSPTQTWTRARFIRFGTSTTAAPTDAQVLSGAQNESNVVRSIDPNGASIMAVDAINEHFWFAYDAREDDLTVISLLGGNALSSFNRTLTSDGNYKIYTRDLAGTRAVMYTLSLTT